jgi:hypothetical protein
MYAIINDNIRILIDGVDLKLMKSYHSIALSCMPQCIGDIDVIIAAEQRVYESFTVFHGSLLLKEVKMSDSKSVPHNNYYIIKNSGINSTYYYMRARIEADILKYIEEEQKEGGNTILKSSREQPRSRC